MISKKVINKNGYTILEMIIVIFIISLLGNFTLFSLKRVFDEQIFKNAFNDFIYDIRYVKERAISGESSNVYILLNQNYYLIKKNVHIEKRVDLPKNIVLYFETSKLAFNLDGTLDTQTSITINMRSRNNKYKKITILKPTGRIKKYE